MDRHEFRLVSPAQIVNRVRGQFFARPAFAFDQNVRRRRSDLTNSVEHFTQRRRFADDIFQTVTLVDLLPEGPIFLLQLAAPNARAINISTLSRLSGLVTKS